MKEGKSETPLLTLVSRQIVDTVLAAAKFKPTVDGARLVRRFEVYGIEVTEWVDVDPPGEDATRQADNQTILWTFINAGERCCACPLERYAYEPIKTRID